MLELHQKCIIVLFNLVFVFFLFFLLVLASANTAKTKGNVVYLFIYYIRTEITSLEVQCNLIWMCGHKRFVQTHEHCCQWPRGSSNQLGSHGIAVIMYSNSLLEGGERE